MLPTNITRALRELRRIRATLKDGPYTSVGCYPLFWWTADGETLSHAAIVENWHEVCSAVFEQDTRSGWLVLGAEVNWEDETRTCAHTNEPIPCAYPND